MPVTSVHCFIQSAAQSSPTLSVTQPQVEFLQAPILGLHVGYETPHGLNNFSVSLSTQRSTCRHTSQGSCQDAPQVLFNLVTLDGEE
jgi:hypothetical protein